MFDLHLSRCRGLLDNSICAVEGYYQVTRNLCVTNDIPEPGKRRKEGREVMGTRRKFLLLLLKKRLVVAYSVVRGQR